MDSLMRVTASTESISCSTAARIYPAGMQTAGSGALAVRGGLLDGFVPLRPQGRKSIVTPAMDKG
jgi:hypothetical protein